MTDETTATGKMSGPLAIQGARTMSGRTIWSAILAMGIVLCLYPRPALAASLPTWVTGAGGWTYPAGTVYNGVTLSTFYFGLGVSLVSGGTATGDFQSTLLGSYAGQPKTFTAVCKAAKGSASAPSTITFSGTCVIDMGGGTAPVSKSFSMTADGSKGTLSLKLDTTTLPILTGTGTNGRITVY